MIAINTLHTFIGALMNNTGKSKNKTNYSSMTASHELLNELLNAQK